jgi:hypothetical protein
MFSVEVVGQMFSLLQHFQRSARMPATQCIVIGILIALGLYVLLSAAATHAARDLAPVQRADAGLFE